MLQKLHAHKVESIMTKQVMTVELDTPIVEAAKLLRVSGYGCVPVVQDKKLVGMCTRTDMLDQLIRTLEPIKE